MRLVFTSQRHENVEGVAALLREHDIEVRIRNGRSYKGNRRGAFSYTDRAPGKPRPEVWVVKSEDQPRARALLREAGLLEDTRLPRQTPDGAAAGLPGMPDPAAGQRRAMRIRVALVALIVLVALFRYL